MAIKQSQALSAVIPLPPMEYDVNYMNALVRVLTLFINQLQNPGPVLGNSMTISDKNAGAKITVNPQDLTGVLSIVATGLPTSSAGLAKGSLWVDTTAGNVLKIVP